MLLFAANVRSIQTVLDASVRLLFSSILFVFSSLLARYRKSALFGCMRARDVVEQKLNDAGRSTATDALNKLSASLCVIFIYQAAGPNTVALYGVWAWMKPFGSLVLTRL